MTCTTLKCVSFLCIVSEPILSSSLSGIFAAQFSSVCAARARDPDHIADITLSVMELAVLLAAGLRDWVDFGVIVRLLPRVAFFLLSTEI
jgi:hypothetical protein